MKKLNLPQRVHLFLYGREVILTRTHKPLLTLVKTSILSCILTLPTRRVTFNDYFSKHSRTYTRENPFVPSSYSTLEQQHSSRPIVTFPNNLHSAHSRKNLSNRQQSSLLLLMRHLRVKFLKPSLSRFLELRSQSVEAEESGKSNLLSRSRDLSRLTPFTRPVNG